MAAALEGLISSLLGNPIALLGAIALTFTCALLVIRAVHFNRARAAARLGLIDPWTHLRTAKAQVPLPAFDDTIRGGELGAPQRELARRLAGLPIRLVPHLFLASRILAAGLFGAVTWLALPWLLSAAGTMSLRLGLAAAAAVFGWLFPNLAALWATRARAARVVAGLPDALELLVICAEGGLSLGNALDRVVTQLRRTQPQLAQELAMTAADLKILPSHEQALARLAARIDAPIVQSVVTTLTQSMRYGTPFAQTVRNVATMLRNESLIRMEEKANKLPTMMTIAMIVFIMPTIFIVVMGPAALSVIDQLYH